MKIKFLPLIAGIFTTATIMTSCLGNDLDDIKLGSESSITAFSIGTVWVPVTGVDQNGNDSVYLDSIDCSGYPFTIDQLNRRIENKDSLPVGADVSRVLTSLTSDGSVWYTKRSDAGIENDTVWSSQDSIDFTYPVTFKVYAYSGVQGTPYTVRVNVHKQVPDSLQWLNYQQTFADGVSLQRQKAVAIDGKVYVFGVRNGETVAQYTTVSTGNPSAWQTVALPAGTDSYSAVVWKDAVWFLASNQLYQLNPGDNTYSSVANAPSLTQLVAATDESNGGQKTILYARNADNRFVRLENETWTEDEEETLGAFAAGQRLSAASMPLSYNKTLVRTILMGNNEGTAPSDTTSLLFSRISNEQSWARYAQSNPLTCPNLENISMIHYDDKLYAFGGKATTGEGEVAPFERFYCSIDNGLTWDPVSRSVTFPEDGSFRAFYESSHGNYSCTVDSEHFIWIIWENGALSRGRINRLGFAPKW